MSDDYKQEIDELRAMVKANTETLNSLNDLFAENGYESLQEAVTELLKIIHGDERLGIPNMRKMVIEIWEDRQRVRWLIVAFGGGTIVGWTIILMRDLLGLGGG